MLDSRLKSLPTAQLDESCDGQRAQAESIAYEMAYGLSHELNNPLANIAGRARLLAEQESDPEKRQQLAIIVDQALRGCEMIADLMQFARPPAWQPTEVDLRPLVADMYERAKRSSRVALPNLVLDVDTHLASTNVKADKQALVEAVWSVLRNAIEAARANVHIRLSSDDQWLKLCILDDGPGLSEKALELAFHPYFSGREAGRGLGLGLSKARRILSLCGGHVSLQNITPTGCQATISLPISLEC